jgi:hypothetical protein
MKVRSVFILGIVLLFGTRAFAQNYPKAEATVDYSTSGLFHKTTISSRASR